MDDIRDEWLDRYGPMPDEAAALLEVALLRAECSRTGVREVAVARDTARISPVSLKMSAQMRLQRRHPKAVYKDDLGQLVVPLPRGAAPATFLRELLAEAIPEGLASVASSTP